MKMTSGIAAQDVVSELEKHVLVDDFRIVIDLQKSRVTGMGGAAAAYSFQPLPEVYKQALATSHQVVDQHLGAGGCPYCPH